MSEDDVKTVIIGDLHIGVRNGNQYLFQMMKRFFNDKFFPYLHDNNITRVIQLGDILDKRKTIDFSIAKFLIDDFFGFFEKNNIHLYSLSGNHDLYYRQSVKLDGPSQFVNGCDYIHIIKQPIQLDDFILIPWVCDENKEDIIAFLDNHRDRKKIVLGHFELAGFPVIKGYIADKGSLDNNVFDGYRKVISGHYHSPSSKDDIIYIGTPYELTWNESGDDKKFYVYDSDTTEIETVPTCEKMFIKIEWNNRDHINEDELTGRFIRLYTPENFNDDDALSVYVDKLDKLGAAEVRVMPKVQNDNEDDDNETINVEDTMSIMLTYIEENLKGLEECSIAKDMAASIYKQAQDESK